mmetsp:Transcript_40615/g.99760  ORF Transcript_40615/g.99760 Transcript_40615/m.99760 type:complete len:238 (-) Transcript_40615:449-1162(-)
MMLCAVTAPSLILVICCTCLKVLPRSCLEQVVTAQISLRVRGTSCFLHARYTQDATIASIPLPTFCPFWRASSTCWYNSLADWITFPTRSMRLHMLSTSRYASVSGRMLAPALFRCCVLPRLAAVPSWSACSLPPAPPPIIVCIPSPPASSGFSGPPVLLGSLLLSSSANERHSEDMLIRLPRCTTPQFSHVRSPCSVISMMASLPHSSHFCSRFSRFRCSDTGPPARSKSRIASET